MMIQIQKQKMKTKKRFQKKSGECSEENIGDTLIHFKSNSFNSRSHSLSDVGTGGTPFMVYLKSIRDATDAAKL
jgi:hypothetical protein